MTEGKNSTEQKLVFRKQRYRNNDNQCRLRISGTAYEQVERLAEQANMTITDVGTKLVEYALRFAVVEE